MELTLTIDCGNSSVKASLFDRDKPLCPVRTAVADAVTDAVGEVMAGADNSSLRGAIYCSVADTGGISAPKGLTDRFAKLLIVCAETPVPITIDYSSRSSLGVDRLAAAVGVSVLLPEKRVMTVDAGSAVTYDLIAADGTFSGGVISPGIGMRLRALHSFTARLPRLEASYARSAMPLPPIGHSTAEAMMIGAVRGTLAEMLYYRNIWGPEATVLTGGHAGLLAGCITDDSGISLPSDICLEPHLVSIGLNRIFSYNEDN